MASSDSKNNIEELKEKKVGKLIMQYAFPSITGMIVLASYLLILQVYIAYGSGLGVHAVGGIGICLPIMVLLTAIGMFPGVGAASGISICLGKEDQETARDLLGNAVTLAIILSLTFTLLFFLFFESILRLIGTTEENYLYVKDFLLIFIPNVVVVIVSGCLNYIMRASGHPKKAMLLLLFGLLLNIVVIPFFLFILKGGIKGAAIAMVLCQWIAFVPNLHHFLKKDNHLPLRMQSLKLNPHIVQLISKIGFSPFLVISSTAIVAFIINNRLTTYGSAFAINTYTISNALLTFFVLILTGLSQGIQPIVGYNYGAGKIDRLFETLKITGITAVTIGIIGWIFTSLFSYPFTQLLSGNNQPVAAEAVRCLRILSIGLPLAGFQLIATSFFQSIGSAGKAFTLSITRQWVFLIPALFVFPLFWQTQGVWYALPFSDASSTLLAAIIFTYQWNELNELKNKNKSNTN